MLNSVSWLLDSGLIAEAQVKSIEKKGCTKLKVAMENNESTQQQSSELTYSKHARSRRPTIPAHLNSLLMLIKHWHWLIWGGMWIFLLAISAIAILSLTYTVGVKEETEPEPVAVENPTGTTSKTNSVPLWLLGTIALTFATGSLVIAKRLNGSSLFPKLGERVKRSSRRALTRRQQRKLLLQDSSVPTYSQPLPSAAPVPAEIEPVVTVLPPEESHPLDSRKQLFIEVSEETEPMVTVLPTEESHSLESKEESLAEMMDIRKHRSLSSILQDL